MYNKLRKIMDKKEAEDLKLHMTNLFEKAKENKKWYIFEGDTYEGSRADLAYLSDIEAYIIRKFFDNKICFYDETYAGTYEMLELGPFDSKEEAVNQYIADGIHTDCLGGTFRLRRPEDLVDEFKDMYKEEKE